MLAGAAKQAESAATADAAFSNALQHICATTQRSQIHENVIQQANDEHWKLDPATDGEKQFDCVRPCLRLVPQAELQPDMP